VTAVHGALLAVGGALAAWTVWWAARPLRRSPGYWSRTNFRGSTVWLLGGPVVIVAALTGLLAVAAAGDRAGLRRTAVAMCVVVAGAGLVGLYDDLHGATHAKGLRGHLTALFRGQVTSGAVKIVGVGLAALAAAAILDGTAWVRLLLDTLVIAGAANLVNLFDLRPGRALKVTLLAAAGLLLVRRPAVGLALCWPAGVMVGMLPLDLRERVMLGDAGANALGAVVGVAAVSTLGVAPRVAVLVVVVALTALSEVVSFSRVIQATPPLRWLDELGRLPVDVPAAP
jgi:UDP-N-acetylmuramyl pentapeptide phosphotransferase/UDP-N-acetylglucosamine-1-phosphate transferase